MSIPIKFHTDWQDSFFKKLDQDGPWSNWENYKLAFDTVQHLAVPTFDGMIAPSYLPGLTPLPHQLEVANTVIEKMNGKAILADEVGLGKTVEAGLILKEYMIRGLVKKVLILVPASLVSQWTFELNTKFHIPAIAQQKKNYVWDRCDVVVSSIDTAKRAPHREAILDISYDLIIIDEAHKLKNNKTKNYEFVQLLKKKFCLLLTATPVQNKIEEIFHLVSLLKPGHLGNKSNFEEYFSAKNRSVEHEDLLRELIGKVMVRNRRSDTGIEWTKRHVETVLIEFNEEERKLYNLIEEWQKSNYTGISSAFSFLTFKREACSSREAVYVSMKKMIQRFEKEGIEVNDPFVEKIFQQINLITSNTKANKVIELIKEINDKVIIFTEYRATQLYLQWLLKQHGITSVPFRGGFKRGKKDWMKELFRNKVQVLIATEAGGEGINLQFCSNMINFDLPWNPMRLEQRIGRIHRLGQTEDVKIFNFATVGSIEEHILRLLYEKIHLFEKVIGELDDILTRIPYQEFEAHLNEIFLNSQTEGEMKIKMENLTSIIQLQQLKQSGDQYAAK